MPARTRPTLNSRRALPSTLNDAQAPLAALLAFGAYLALALAWGVATFRTVPEEAELLQKVGGGCQEAAAVLQEASVLGALCNLSARLRGSGGEIVRRSLWRRSAQHTP